VSAPKLVTAVVGAGPAGLLFAFVSRVLAERDGTASRWVVRLFDKREHYERTHRLRMDPEPYRAIGEALDDPRYDELLTFLQDESFRPAVNELEERLVDLVRSVGVEKKQLSVGDADGDTTLDGLRIALRDEGTLADGDVLTIVAADSVHSVIRTMVRGGVEVRDEVHQLVARLKVEGADLPEALPILEQLKLSKLLGSIMDYRRNQAGHAEVDLFLDGAEHRAVDALGAKPKSPVKLDDAVLRDLKAPLFRKIVDYLRYDFVPATGCDVTLWSSFVLEHRSIDRVSYQPTGLAAPVFLVGDAAVSLPFFRGMASLACCAQALAEEHAAMARRLGEGGDAGLAQAADAYQRRVTQVVARELGIVKARSRLIQGTREFIRLSALLPFPMQTWFLSVPDESVAWRVTPAVVLNGLVALGGLVLATAAPLVAPALADGWPERLAIGGGMYAATALFQMAGGVLYRHTRNVDLGAAATAKWVWLLQMLGLILGGVGITLTSMWRAWGMQPVPAFAWLGFGIFFAVGILLYEALERRWWGGAQL
jgi:hypothetical protein